MKSTNALIKIFATKHILNWGKPIFQKCLQELSASLKIWKAKKEINYIWNPLAIDNIVIYEYFNSIHSFWIRYICYHLWSNAGNVSIKICEVDFAVSRHWKVRTATKSRIIRIEVCNICSRKYNHRISLLPLNMMGSSYSILQAL